MTSSRTDTAAWWRAAVTYQVYPRSFADGDGDGIGDIAGIRSRLPYIRDLGVDAIWLNPWYPSPMADAGYDVADYRAIDPLFGTLADAEALIAEARALDLRVLLDIVPNHLSSDHAWFQAALAAGPGSQERERFLFRPGRGDGSQPPNDWESVFGGSAWTRIREPDGRPGEWYLHLFDPGQPDLNWREPDVHAEFEAVLRFWFDRGVDGFRIDVANGLHKHEDLPDLGERSGRPGDEAEADHPFWDRETVHEVYREWRRVADSYRRPEDVRRRGVGPDPGPPRPLRPPRSSPQRLQLRLSDDAVAGGAAPGEHRRGARGTRRGERRTHMGAVEPRRRPRRQPSRSAAAQRAKVGARAGRRDGRPRSRPRHATRTLSGTPDARAAGRCLRLPGRGARALGGPRSSGGDAGGSHLGTFGTRAARTRWSARPVAVGGGRSIVRFRPIRRRATLVAAASRLGRHGCRAAGGRPRLDARAVPHGPPHPAGASRPRLGADALARCPERRAVDRARGRVPARRERGGTVGRAAEPPRGAPRQRSAGRRPVFRRIPRSGCRPDGARPISPRAAPSGS